MFTTVFRLPVSFGVISAFILAAPVRADDIQNSEAYRAAIKLIGDKLEPGARYLDKCIDGSGEVSQTYPGYEGFPVRRCIYERGGYKAFVYTLHPDRTQMATWIANACASLPASKQSDCARYIWWGLQTNIDYGRIWGSNNAQYPVAGYVLEKGDESGCPKKDAYYYLQFRDGVTVSTTSAGRMCVEAPANKKSLDLASQQAEASAPVKDVYFVSRVAAITPRDYQRANCDVVPRTHVFHSGRGEYHPTEAWLALSKKANLDGIRSGKNPFVDAVARVKYGPLPNCASGGK